MVSSQLTGLTKGRTCKTFDPKFLFPPLGAVAPEQVELDFSDVFGPLPVQASIEVNCGELDSTVSAAGASELIYDEPAIVYSRSHSLFGPSSCVSQSLKLSKLTLRETGDSVDIIECVKEETINEVEEHSFGDGGDEKSPRDVNGDHLKVGSIGIEDFEVLKVVGQGAFGKVYQVRKKGTPEIYAMKVMRKDKIMEKNHAEYMKAERDILTKVDHPFIVQLKYSFQTKYRLYLVLDFINGGHLFFQLYHHGLFREDLARLYTAEIVSAVSHLHANGIMHRDLKPENILLDADGYAMLTDFGLAKQFDENTRSNSLCGTVEYMSPEIITGKGHDKAADWWSVGILLYEMLTGKPPFIGGNREKIQQKIVKERIKLPTFLSGEAHSLLKGLLHKDVSKRLGSGPTGSEEIKRHKWFKPINWKKLEAREIQPCFRPEVAGKHCIANFDKRWTNMPVSFSPASSPKTNFISQVNLSTLTNRLKCNPGRCNAFFGSIPDDLLERSLSQLPVMKSGFVRFETVTGELTEVQKWGFIVFAGLTWIYLTARPGVLLGAIDAYLLAPLQLGLDSLTGRRSLKRSDFLVGDKLGEGSFGIVYSGVIVPKNVSVEEKVPKRGGRKALDMDGRFKEKVILKKVKVGVQGAEECGDYEEWFNYRLSRAAPETCAEFLGSFVADKTNSQFIKGGKWLVWKFEGDRTLADYMKERSFPLNIESVMFGRVLQGVESVKRNALIIKQIMRQIIASLKKIHDTGIVHRDVKPANLVVTKRGQIKLIDFGAATDLRIGKNYVPNRGLLDPDYCPPELYVLPEETPSPPPEPIAAFLSPILWQLNSPDLFDMYSVGIVLLQMAIPSLRSTAYLKNFNSELKAVQYDLNQWREKTRLRPDFTILDLESGRGWDLATKLISERGFLRRGRLSAAAALRHPYFLLGGDQAAAVLSKFSFN